MLPAAEREWAGAATAFRPLAQELQRGASARRAGHANSGGCYHPSAKRLGERVKPRLYPLGTEIRRLDSAGFIGLEGGRGYVGEAFIGVDVALERSKNERPDSGAVCQCEAWTARAPPRNPNCFRPSPTKAGKPSRSSRPRTDGEVRKFPGTSRGPAPNGANLRKNHANPTSHENQASTLLAIAPSLDFSRFLASPRPAPAIWPKESVSSQITLKLVPFGPAPKPPEFAALGQWGRMPCHPGRGGKVACHCGPEAGSPVGKIHRSGCSPAEPYPADDTAGSGSRTGLASTDGPNRQKSCW